jgi:hypothetical protein
MRQSESMYNMAENRNTQFDWLCRIEFSIIFIIDSQMVIIDVPSMPLIKRRWHRIQIRISDNLKSSIIRNRAALMMNR